jgi:hypothetical protein
MTITGGCLCGAVRYTSSAAPIIARVCWCRDCQYFAAGAGTVNAVFRVGTFEVTGETRDFAGTADSGNRMHRRFCPVCGTPMFSAAESRPELIIARAGTLDDPQAIRPSATIWTASAPNWACIAEDLPKFDGQPPPL